MIGRCIAKAVVEQQPLPPQLLASRRGARARCVLLSYLVAPDQERAADAEACGTCGAPSAERALVEVEEALAVLAHHAPAPRGRKMENTHATQKQQQTVVKGL